MDRRIRRPYEEKVHVPDTETEKETVAKKGKNDAWGQGDKETGVLGEDLAEKSCENLDTQRPAPGGKGN